MSDYDVWVGLAEKARNGDVEAFASLVDRFKRPLCASIYPMLQDWHATQDLAQEAFVAAYQGLSELRDPRRFRAWLFMIARNRAVSLLRRDSRQGISSLDHLEEGELPPLPGPSRRRPHGGSKSGRMSAAAAARMRRAILALPNGYGTLLVMRYMEGMTIPEIAEVLGREPVSIKASLHRARTLARDMLRKAGITMEKMLYEV